MLVGLIGAIFDMIAAPLGRNALVIGALEANALRVVAIGFVAAIGTIRMTVAFPAIRQAERGAVAAEVVRRAVHGNVCPVDRCAVLFVSTVHTIVIAVACAAANASIVAIKMGKPTYSGRAWRYICHRRSRTSSLGNSRLRRQMSAAIEPNDYHEQMYTYRLKRCSRAVEGRRN